VAIILIDSCVVTDLANEGSSWFEWSASTLEALDDGNKFIINPMIYAECSMGYDTIEEVESLVGVLEFDVEEVPREALFLAGRAYLQYRKIKATKSNVLPDFFIGAHAAVERYKLMTRDKGRFSTYFPSVELIMPDY